MKDQKKALTEAGPNGVPFEDAAKQFHITYMIGNDQPRFQPIERIKSAGMATGYRFRVSAAEITGNDLKLTVTNDGVAPIYRDAHFAAGRKRSWPFYCGWGDRSHLWSLPRCILFPLHSYDECLTVEFRQAWANLVA